MNVKGIEELDLITNAALTDHFDLEVIFNGCSNKDIEGFINYYLNNIKNITNKVINISICNTALESFDYNYQVNDQELFKANANVMEEANIICDDLVKKITNSNGRSIELPVSIDSIIDYGISSYINPKDINKLLYYVTIKLSVIYNFYKD